MPLLSHAQNGEDIVLHRALKDVEKGHYIDVGACDPTELSVTKLFYDLGWSGVNIEPSRSHHAHLAAERTGDMNLNVAVAARPGLLRLHHFAGTGLSTLVDDVASAARDKGFAAEAIDVPVLTLADICRSLPFSTTHFLKIDVEGSEREVLLGADFTTFRPWIIVVEATKPLSTVRADGEWRDIIEGADYECVLFDGVNLYFLAREHAELREQLAIPANVLDDYVPARVLAVQEREAALNVQVSNLDAEVRRRDALIAAQTAEVQANRAHIASLQAHAGTLQAERDGFNADVRRLTEDLLEARVTLRVISENLERELAGARQEVRLEAESRLAELGEAREQLAGLAHFKAQSERLRQISDLTGAGAHLEERGTELLKLRAGLLQQADAWQTEIEDLQTRLGEALARFDLLQASTSWRVTSPLRGLRRATHLLQREPHRLPGLMRQSARNLLRRPSALHSPAETAPDIPSVEIGTRALVSVAARLDSEMALIADLLGSLSSALSDDDLSTAGPFYSEARLDEQLTQWILGEVVRQRHAAL